MEIAAWLSGLGLPQYEEAFRSNEISAELLPSLTSDDLRELGIASLGHRKRILAAIAALSEAAPSPAPSPAPHAAAAPQAERRHLTVMLVDLVGSTLLSRQLDPEEMQGVLRAYQDKVAGEILRYEGHVAKFIGDGVLAYFGFPRAQEDDAERAVRAGLSIVRAISSLAGPRGEPLACRVGIATGRVVIGDLIGSGAVLERGVFGETPNLAARLQEAARPSGVVIAEGTRRLLGRLFEIEPLGLLKLPGLADPVAAFEVTGELAAESRFEALHPGGPVPLVGRDEELALILRSWEEVKSGEGQVVLLSGEPGIGKSRLILALRERLKDEPCARRHYQCSPFRRNTALWPVIQALERSAGFRREDPAEAKLAKLEALAGESGLDGAEAMALMAGLLSIPTLGRYPNPDLTPQGQKDRLLAALLDQLKGIAVRQPVLEVFEDVHWIDPTSAELLELTVDFIRSLPVLLAVTCRPEFQQHWASRTPLTSLSLNRLSRKQGAAMVERITAKTLPPEVLDQIVLKTDGVPLFIEELTKTVLESGLLREEGNRYELAGGLPALAIPATLQDSLMARLDRLAPVREVAQIGAVIGREFPHALLAAVAPLGAGELEHALLRLIEAELVFRRGLPPDATYTFKHALVRDTAYENLLKSRRKELHGRIARALEERFPETVAAEPELLAHHCTQAGYLEKAIEYWQRAGEVALARSALAEAVAQLRQGLAVLGSLPDGRERRRRELGLQMALGGALIAAKGYAAPETGAVFARAQELTPEAGDAGMAFRALYGEWAYRTVKGELEAGHKLATEFMRLASEQGGSDVLVIGHRALGVSSVLLGRPTAARSHFERSLALYDPARHRGLVGFYAFDQRAAALSFLSLVLYLLGHLDQAARCAGAALAAAEDSAHRATQAYALNHAVLLHQLEGDRPAVESLTADLLNLASKHGLPFWLAAARIQRGWLKASLGEPETGSAEIEEALADYRATGSEHMVPYYLTLHAEADAAAGRRDRALELAREAQAAIERSGERWYEAAVHRLEAELLPARSGDLAEASLERSLAIARAQQAKSLELRTATALARLWRDRGRPAAARDLLAPACRWFTEGLERPDLKAARGLLDELARAPASAG